MKLIEINCKRKWINFQAVFCSRNYRQRKERERDSQRKSQTDEKKRKKMNVKFNQSISKTQNEKRTEL